MMEIIIAWWNSKNYSTKVNFYKGGARSFTIGPWFTQQQDVALGELSHAPAAGIARPMEV